MKVVWSKNAQYSYDDELDFIAKKWTLKEVHNFMNLVNNYIQKLGAGIIEGKISPKTKIRFSIISKQTTLFFTVNKNKKTINLLLFWNNLKNPKELKKRLHSFN